MQQVIIDNQYTDADFEKTSAALRGNLLQELEIRISCQVSDAQNELVVKTLLQSFQQLIDSARPFALAITSPELIDDCLSVRLTPRKFQAEAKEAQAIECLLNTMKWIEINDVSLRVHVGGLVRVSSHSGAGVEEEIWIQEFERNLQSHWENLLPAVVQKKFRPQMGQNKYRKLPV